MSKKIKVLIVDDSALVRQMLSKILAEDSDIEVVGVASDPYVARDKIKKLNPDVITLDVEMPRMDGLTFLENLMRLRPMPVVMVSTLTEKGADTTLQALELGAVDFVSKPKVDFSHSIQDYSDELICKVKVAAGANVRALEALDAPAVKKVKAPLYGKLPAIDPKFSADAILKKSDRPGRYSKTDRIIAMGASTGGTEAIKAVLMSLPAECPGIVVAQHIPEAFSKQFADRINRICSLEVREAEDGMQVMPGSVYIAPGNRHLLIERDGNSLVCKLSDGPRVNRHRPSVDVLFRSVAQSAGPYSTGVILTGMGDDGARGIKELKDAGASTIAQDEKTSVVWGMPSEAVNHGGVDSILPLQKIAEHILKLTTNS